MHLRTAILVIVVVSITLPAPGRAYQQEPDSLSVEDVVRGVRGGAPWAPDVVDRVARGCRGSDPGSWERRVLAGLMESPLASYFGAEAENWTNRISSRVAAATTYAARCGDLGDEIDRWIRDAFYADLDEDAFVPLMERLLEARGYLLVTSLIEDPEADAMHRMWATEAVLGPPLWDAFAPETRPRMRVDELAAVFSRRGLPEAYVNKWLPTLLASIYTREAVVLDLAPEVARRASSTSFASGVAAIVRIMGANVEAYDYRFSEEARAAVTDLMDDLRRREDQLPALVSEAVRDAESARAEGRNHEGVVVSREDLSLDAAEVGGTCALTGPVAILDAVETAVPGYRIDNRRECGATAISYGDFDGDGAQDALVRILVGEARSAVAVLGGNTPLAYPIQVREYAEVRPPGSFRDWTCGPPRTVTFPNHYIVAAGLYRFDGEAFEILPGGQTCL